jgi:anti-sigma factor RsiW
MIGCDDVRPLLGAYADKELNPLEADAVAVHLDQCGRCRQVVRDQQHVQHVLNSFQPAAVADHRWAEIGKRLRAELEGKGERAALKTRPRIESLEPTPVATPSLRAEELATPPRPASRAPGAAARTPSVTVFKVRPPRRRDRFGWTAHVLGAVAATIVIALGMASTWTGPLPVTPAAPSPLGPIALAGPRDVRITDVEMTDPNYNLVISAGDANDVAAVYVVPAQDNG